MNSVTIVIPVYKSTLSDSERISLEQCCQILGKHPFTLVCPPGLAIDEYVSYFDKHAVSYTCVHFDKIYFQNIEGYNRLLLSIDFYKAFENFTYILIHQLDALVFKDELAYWCSKGYDYIGAPWFKRFWRFKPSKTLYAIGNGGLSLRKVQSCLDVLSHTGRFKPLRYCFSFHNSILLKLKKMPLKKWHIIKFENSVHFFTFINRQTEDRFWCLDTRHAYVDFAVAPLEDGIKFAFECHPSYLFTLNHGLPFGCHAWDRYEPAFWKNILKKEFKKT